MLKPALPYTLFISDLHLSAERPQTTRLLLDFLSNTARGARTLYVLGDLFEYWAGDDDRDTPLYRDVGAAFRALSHAGTTVFFMHGNRDFLLGEEYAQEAGIALLPDPWLIDLHGRSALLTHGDTLCTDDVEYQAFRRQVRDSKWQRTFLALPLQQRKMQIEALRMRSEQEKSYKMAAIMDVNPQAVLEMLRRHNYPPLLIHGHTHRPAAHAIEDDGHSSTRWVLGDWHEHGDYLYCNASGCRRLPVGSPDRATGF